MLRRAVLSYHESGLRQRLQVRGHAGQECQFWGSAINLPDSLLRCLSESRVPVQPDIGGIPDEAAAAAAAAAA